MTNNELIMLQALPLEIKIAKTELRIKEWVDHFGINKVYVSFSGGKDSTVLAHICRKLYPNIKMAFSNTGQEYPETISFVIEMKKQGWNIDIVRPKFKFKEVLEKYGYPVVSKEQSQYIYDVKRNENSKTAQQRLGNIKNKDGKKTFAISDKWLYLIKSDFKISDKCCSILKKNPIKKYEKDTGRKAIIGVMAGESALRKTVYLKEGCNSFSGREISRPLGFWLEQDIWDYIRINNIEISECYTKHGMDRTGCYGCLFGCHLEEKLTGTNRIEKLKVTHPKLYNHLIDNLDYKKVMDILKLKY